MQTGLLALERGIVYGTAGNFSEIDRVANLVAISPSGIPYAQIGHEEVLWWTLPDYHVRHDLLQRVPEVWRAI